MAVTSKVWLLSPAGWYATIELQKDKTALNFSSNFYFLNIIQIWMTAHTCNLNIWEAKAGGATVLGLHSDNLYRQQKMEAFSSIEL